MTPTEGEMDNGDSCGMQNSNILWAFVGASPLMTELFIRDKRGLLICIRATEVEVTGVAANDIEEWESSRAGSTPIPLHCNLYSLYVYIVRTNKECIYSTC